MSALGKKGRSKYENCVTKNDILQINQNYSTDLFGNEWNYDLTSLTDAKELFRGNKNVKKFNGNLSSATDISLMFYDGALQSVSMDVRNATKADNTFRNQRITFWKGEFPKLENGTGTFQGTQITSFTDDLPKLTTGTNMFRDNASFISFSGDLSKLSNGTSMFQNNSKMTTFDSSLPKLSNGSNMFANTALDKSSIYNILGSLPTYTSGSHSISLGISTNNVGDEDIPNLIQEAKNNGWSVSITYTGEIPRDNEEFVEQFKEEITLPDGYTRCEYLEDTGVQWINTEYVPTNNTGIWTLAKSTNSKCNGYPLGSGLDATGISAPAIMMNGTVALMYNAYKNFGSYLYTSNISFYLGCTNWLGDKKGIIDTGWFTYSAGALQNTLTFTPTLPIYIFRSNTGTSTARYFYGRIFRAKISEGENIVRDFIPALDENNKPCMYEIMESKTYYNSGTGADFKYKILDE